MGVEDCVRAEENNLEIYMKKSEERLILAVNDILYEEGESVCESADRSIKRKWRMRESECMEN